VLFRHALLLDGVASTARKRDVVTGAGDHFGIETAPFLTLLDLREEKIRAKEIEPEPLFARYINQIEKVIDAVDVIAK
jgi:hypothetical protein